MIATTKSLSYKKPLSATNTVYEINTRNKISDKLNRFSIDSDLRFDSEARSAITVTKNGYNVVGIRYRDQARNLEGKVVGAIIPPPKDCIVINNN